MVCLVECVYWVTTSEIPDKRKNFRVEIAFCTPNSIQIVKIIILFYFTVCVCEVYPATLSKTHRHLPALYNENRVATKKKLGEKKSMPKTSTKCLKELWLPSHECVSLHNLYVIENTYLRMWDDLSLSLVYVYKYLSVFRYLSHHVWILHRYFSKCGHFLFNLHLLQMKITSFSAALLRRLLSNQ